MGGLYVTDVRRERIPLLWSHKTVFKAVWHLIFLSLVYLFYKCIYIYIFILCADVPTPNPVGWVEA